MKQYYFWVAASVPYVVEAETKEQAVSLYEDGYAELKVDEMVIGDLEEVVERIEGKPTPNFDLSLSGETPLGEQLDENLSDLDL